MEYFLILAFVAYVLVNIWLGIDNAWKLVDGELFKDGFQVKHLIGGILFFPSIILSIVLLVILALIASILVLCESEIMRKILNKKLF